MKSIFATLCVILLITGCIHSQDPLINYLFELEVLLDSLELEADQIHIEIDKSEFILSVVADTLVIKQYPIVLGGNYRDDKLRQGDRCTPEGRFRVITKYPHRSWDKFIWIDYPNEDSWRKHRQAKLDGSIEESAGIGGEIGIHGVPNGADELIDLGVNWTLGCISLKNKDIDDFYPFIHKGTLVVIEK